MRNGLIIWTHTCKHTNVTSMEKQNRDSHIRKHINVSRISGSHGGEYEMTVFWVVAPCSLVEVHQRFRGSCCLHHHGGKSMVTNNGSHHSQIIVTKPLLWINTRNGLIIWTHTCKHTNVTSMEKQNRDSHIRKHINVSRIWGSHGGEYEDDCLLGCRTPCSLIEVYRRFRGSCCLHDVALQPRRQQSSHK
jgi:hypothetical protein